MRIDARPRHSERGIAMVIALLVLLVLSLLAVVAMSTLTMERAAAGQGVRSAHALNAAEAGVAEALARIQSGEADLDTTRVKSVAQVFLCAAGSVPVLGTDSTALATSQTVTPYLSYSTARRDSTALTVSFKTDGSRTKIYRYDPTLATPVNTKTGEPIYVITSTGRDGSALRTVVAEVVRKPIVTTLRGGLVTNVVTSVAGSCQICGYNHDASTPANDGVSGRGTVGGATPDTKHCWDNETGSGDMPAVWSTKGVTASSGRLSGSPSGSVANNSTAFYQGPWEALNMTQADFINWVGSPTTHPENLDHIVRYDNNTVLGDRSAGTYQLTAGMSEDSEGSGFGFLYVDGDLQISGNFIYRGLIYVEGDFRMNGNAWILGGLIVRGNTSVSMNSGNSVILYSSDTISQTVSNVGTQFVTLSWRER